MKIRHDELAKEMIRRGFNHKSPYKLPDLSVYREKAKVNKSISIKDLSARCEKFKDKIKAGIKI